MLTALKSLSIDYIYISITILTEKIACTIPVSGFFTTKNTKKHLGLYLGPRVKKAYAKNKGGYYGAWVEYGDDVMHFGKYKSRATQFLNPAWRKNKIKMLSSTFTKAEEVAVKAIKRHERRLKKYGTLGY